MTTRIAVPAPVRPPVARRVLDRPLTSFYLVAGASGFLLALGLVMVFSASSVHAYATSGSSLSIVQKQALWAAVGLPLTWWVSHRSVGFFRALAIPALLVSIGLLCLVLVPGFGVSVNGNQNWLNFGGPFRVQPSEAAKLALVLWAADLLARKQKLLTQWRHLVIPLVPGCAFVIGLVLLGGDLGTAILLMGIVGGLLFIAGAPARLFAVLSVGGLGVIAVLSVTATHRLNRFQAWLHPNSDLTGIGWQAVHGKFALASGGWWGLGLGASREKWGALPEAHTDFIFAIIGEELGLLGTLTVLALFATVMYAGLRIALRSKDPFVRYASGGVTAWMAVQVFVNVGAVAGLLPITGVPLPLVSYGGSALLPTMVALGMLLAFARQEPGAQAALAARGPGRVRRLLTRPARQGS